MNILLPLTLCCLSALSWAAKSGGISWFPEKDTECKVGQKITQINHYLYHEDVHWFDTKCAAFVKDEDCIGTCEWSNHCKKTEAWKSKRTVFVAGTRKSFGRLRLLCCTLRAAEPAYCQDKSIFSHSLHITNPKASQRRYTLKKDQFIREIRRTRQRMVLEVCRKVNVKDRKCKAEKAKEERDREKNRKNANQKTKSERDPTRYPEAGDGSLDPNGSPIQSPGGAPGGSPAGAGAEPGALHPWVGIVGGMLGGGLGAGLGLGIPFVIYVCDAISTVPDGYTGNITYGFQQPSDTFKFPVATVAFGLCGSSLYNATCQSDATWTNFTACPQTCNTTELSPATFTNGEVTYSSAAEVPVGEVAPVACDPSATFALTGPTSYTCGLGGVWDAPFSSECVAGCVNSDLNTAPLTEGTLEFPTTPNTAVGASASVVCNGNHTFSTKGNPDFSLYTCTGADTWTPGVYGGECYPDVDLTTTRPCFSGTVGVTPATPPLVAGNLAVSQCAVNCETEFIGVTTNGASLEVCVCIATEITDTNTAVETCAPCAGTALEAGKFCGENPDIYSQYQVLKRATT